MGLIQDGILEITCNGKKVTHSHYDVKAEDMFFTLKINGSCKEMPPRVFMYSVQNGAGYSGGCAIKNDGEGMWSFIHKTLVFDDEAAREILFIISHPGIDQIQTLTVRAIKENTGYRLPLPASFDNDFRQHHLAILFAFDEKFKNTPLHQGKDSTIRTRCHRWKSAYTIDTEFSEAPDNPFLSVRRLDAEKLKLNIPVICFGNNVFFPMSYRGDGYYGTRGVIKHLPAGNYMLGVRLPKDPYMNYGYADISILSENDYKEMISEMKRLGNKMKAAFLKK